MRVLVVDAANVMGSRPDGWWRDRAAAAGRLHDALMASDDLGDPVVLVLEGAARPGRPVGEEGRVRTVHASGSGDEAIVEVVVEQVAADDGREVVVVTADRGLRKRVEATGATTMGPSWLLQQLSPTARTDSVGRRGARAEDR